jgi:4'-phosphopantetheinyl transferase
MNDLRHTTLPLRPRVLPEEQVAELWLIRLSAIPLDASRDANDRKGRLRQQRMRQQFMLRLLLGSYLGCPGRDVELVRSERGKPVLGEKHADCPLRFNLSHSGDWLAVVVGSAAHLGVDIECERPMVRAIALAKRYFPEDEARSLAGLDEPFLSRRFLQYWTARESLVKAHGCGLAGVLNRIHLGGSPPAIRQLPDDWPAANRWSLVMPHLPAGLVAHVASQSTGLKIRSIVLDHSAGSG